MRPILLLTIACVLLGAAESVVLRAPLTTVVPATGALPADPAAVVAVLVVPPDAPDDLGVGAFIADDDGQWYQRFHPTPLGPGRHELRFALDGALHGEPHRGTWTPYHRHLGHHAGLFLWSAAGSRAEITIEDLHVAGGVTPPPTADHRFEDLETDGLRWQADGGLAITTGEPLEIRLRPSPVPADPRDHAAFALELELHAEDGTARTLAGFYREPMALRDRGSHEGFRPAGRAGFALRHRFRQAGRWRATLVARWADGSELRSELPPITVDGGPWDDYVRVDPEDPRFFATGGGEFVWPIGINARSVNDPRGRDRTGSLLSPDRRWHAYEAYLQRWAAGGLRAAEIWMSSWNLALEWRDDWPGFAGVGRYSQVNAERLDRILDRAHELGLRINLVIHNHGQASEKTDAEWMDNPYNAHLRGASEGGPINGAHDFFTDPAALAGQERLRRYIIARWASHPAVLGWKLWTEMNLTAGRQHDLREWHVQAAARWTALDPYDHPITSHWSGNYRTPDRAIVAQEGLDYICIDAYHGRRDDQRGTLFADLAWDGLHHRWHGLGQFGKPILITEYGGNWDAAPQPQLISEHHHGPWACLVSGYAGSPMLWWLEWVDQSARYAPYAAVAAFIAGEDLRTHPGSRARGVRLQAQAGDRDLWCRAWTRPGRILGYVLDPTWGYDGSPPEPIAGAEVVIGSDVRAGPITVEWWDAETGTITDSGEHQHPGGELRIAAPDFTRHLAFKLWRHDDG